MLQNAHLEHGDGKNRTYFTGLCHPNAGRHVAEFLVCTRQLIYTAVQHLYCITTFTAPSLTVNYLSSNLDCWSHEIMPHVPFLGSISCVWYWAGQAWGYCGNICRNEYFLMKPLNHSFSIVCVKQNALEVWLWPVDHTVCDFCQTEWSW